MESLGKSLIDLILPPRCGLCGEFRAGRDDPLGLCPSCREDLTREERPWCAVCGGIVEDEGAGAGAICRDCRIDPPPFDRAAPAAIFAGPLAQAIRDLKYRRRVELAPVLGRIAARINWPTDYPERFDLVLPVPLHPTRLRSRGFNQAALVCRSLDHLGPLEADLLVRTRPTRPQVELEGPARRLNVRGAFGLRDADRVRGKTVLLVDDVITTGATCRECGSVLKRAGASQVLVRSLAGAVGF